MIIGIGIDQVAVKRFATWHQQYTARLHRLFSPAEVAYCTSAATAQQQAERFAVRFAAKEAFYKAYAQAATGIYHLKPLPLLRIAAHVQVERMAHGMPALAVNWQTLLGADAIAPKAHVSLTHTADVATAFVILELA